MAYTPDLHNFLFPSGKVPLKEVLGEPAPGAQAKSDEKAKKEPAISRKDRRAAERYLQKFQKKERTKIATETEKSTENRILQAQRASMDVADRQRIERILGMRRA